MLDNRGFPNHTPDYSPFKLRLPTCMNFEVVSRVYEVERVLNCTYTSDEHHWDSNVTFSAAHVSTIVPSLALFCFSPHSSQHSSSTVAEPVNTVGRDSQFLQW